MEYLEKLKVYGDQVKNVVVKSMVDTAHGGQKMLKDVLPGNLVTREFEVKDFHNENKIRLVGFYSLFDHWDLLVRAFFGEFMEQLNEQQNRFV
jgi:hypothetical protein